MFNKMILMTLTVFSGFIITYASILLLIGIAFRKGILAHPGGRNLHEKPTPLLGGAAIFAPFALVFAVVLAFILTGNFPGEHPTMPQMISLFIGSAWILCLGTYDDIIKLGWSKKLLGQCFGIAILLIGGHSVSRATVPFFGPVDFGWIGLPVFAVTVLIITNAVNLIDGLDGLAGGVCFFAAVVSGIIGLFKGDLFTALIGFTFSGALLGFLRFNFPPASIYMGDGGSLMLGFVLGTLATSCVAAFPGQRSGTMGMIVIPFLPFGIAVFDVILAIARRWIRGQRIFLADGDHLHHRLMAKFRHPFRVVIILYFFSALLSAMTICMVLGPQSEVTKGFIYAVALVMFVVTASVLIRLYGIGDLPRVWVIRPHFRHLSDFPSCMTKKIRRAESLDDLICLTESGVSDLGLDAVEVIDSSDGRIIKRFVNPCKRHEGAPTSHWEKTIDGPGITIRAVFPTHTSKSYQRFLKLTWYRFVAEIEKGTKNLVSAGRSERSIQKRSPVTLDGTGSGNVSGYATGKIT